MRIFSETRPDINMAHKTRRFRIENLPRVTPETRWRTEAMRSYAQPLLLWFTRGQGRITVAGVTHGFGPHHAVFLPANTMHGYEMTGQVFGTAVYLPPDRSLNLPEEPLHLRFRDVQQQAELSNMIENIQNELKSDRPGKDRAMLAHAGLLSVWLDREVDGGDRQDLHPDAARRLAAAYSAMVERDFKHGQTINYFAAQLGVTPTHLTRCCKIASGRSASALLADRIHFEARRLLTETRRPVKEIADELGFNSAAYFTRAFQKQTGVTPTTFRKLS
ncbi:helix-turn-helix domain-containing protein [Psychromarinibacter halotolerans]|uniref:Helix-turn-helix domain-containing protein n=1 Tax=Psychromarinibacter halotolerans TaxID=1775175 RepID=A0ABV7GUB5_9RHOB|nr:AraC family transcriptional regulator [Psychromarinibacter halotolerans]MDF0594865.1 AraC family transcriptional regulator [Psychromarinibacter halotolerans]